MHFFHYGKVFLKFYEKFPMFHVEHRVCMYYLTLFIVLFGLSACNKPNPNPELADPIYLDLQQQAQNAKKDLEAELKKLEGLKKDLDAAIPQTGAIKYAQKHYFESEARVSRLQQEFKYFELKAASRKIHGNKEYTKAFKEGKSWPDSEEVEAYKVQKEISNINPSWQTKKRVEAYDLSKAGPSKGASTEKNGKE